MSQQPLVIDNGSGLIKCGLAGGDRPKSILPNLIGRPKHERVMAGGIEQDYFVGKMASQYRGILKLSHPISHGSVEDWEGMQSMWQQCYDELSLPSEEHPVVLTEAPLGARKDRERAAQIFFETFTVPALFFANQAVLSLYASGRTTGLVLDSGDGVTHAVPVYECFSIPSAIRRINVAGRDVTEYLRLQLQLQGHDFHTSAEMEIVRILKERACYVKPVPSSLISNPTVVSSTAQVISNLSSTNSSSSSSSSSLSLNSPSSASNSSIDPLLSSASQAAQAAAHPSAQEPSHLRYRLPDGTVLELGPERHHAPEILFNPSLIGEEYEGIHQCVVSSISRTDRDLRSELYSNIILSGGSTTLKYFGDRLLNELKALAPPDVKIKIYAPPERMFTTWIGGSILASLGTFKSMWVSSLDYSDEGPNILHKKSF